MASTSRNSKLERIMSHYDSVSLIVSVYNHGWILEHTLQRLVSQDYPGPLEVILCDDGSSLETFGIIENQLRGIDVRYIWQPHCGMRLARSRNNGLRCARGDIVICLDADVAVGPDFVSRHVATHPTSPAVVCGTRKWLFASDCDLEKVGLLVSISLSQPEFTVKMHSEASYQSHYAKTSTPWMACVGSNFSFRRKPGAFF